MRFTALTLVVCSPCLAFTRPDTAQEPIDPGPDSKALAQHVEKNYAEYLETYLRLFVAHVDCDFEFVDDEVMNLLADDVIREIRDYAGDAVVSYAAGLAALARPAPGRGRRWRVSALPLLDDISTRRSREISAEFEALGDGCAVSNAVNAERYAELRRVRRR